MRTYLECIPCFIRQTLESARFVTDDETVHEKVLREVLRASAELDMHDCPPAMGRRIHQLIKQVTGNDDPYREAKDRFNKAALALYPELKATIEASDDPFTTALKLAIAGNIIDFGPTSSVHEDHVHASIAHALSASLDERSVETFRKRVDEVDGLLYLGDNTGEIVFDRLLVEELPLEKVTFVVRGEPIINDVTRHDAEVAGLTDLVEVIDNGSDAPGTILETCSQAFRERFASAELILAKGQGNYESLSDVPGEIYFALKAKCPVIARHLGCEIGSMVFRRSEPL